MQNLITITKECRTLTTTTILKKTRGRRLTLLRTNYQILHRTVDVRNIFANID